MLLECSTALARGWSPCAAGKERPTPPLMSCLSTNRSSSLSAPTCRGRSGDHQFQLWLHRKEEPKFVSAGVFTPDDNNHAVVEYNEGSLLSEISFVSITEEPTGGSSSPTAPRLFDTSPGAAASSKINEADLPVEFWFQSLRRDTLRSPACRARCPNLFRRPTLRRATPATTTACSGITSGASSVARCTVSCTRS